MFDSTRNAVDWQREACLLAAVFLVGIGIVLRVTTLSWDAGALLHADERYLVMLLTALEWPTSVAQYLNSAESPLNPLNLRDVSAYVYGTLPLFVAKLWIDVTGVASLADAAFYARVLVAVTDCIAIVIVFLLGRDTFSYRTGLLAAVFYALAVLPLQLSHFFTVDPFLNLFLLLSLLLAVRLAGKGRTGDAWLLGLFWGCALASKLSALPFLPVLVAAALLGARGRDWRIGARSLCYALLAAALAFRLFQPYAFSGLLTLDPRFVDVLQQLRSLQGLDAQMPPSIQWAGRSGLLFPLENMALWGLGPLLFLAGLAGAALAGISAWRRAQAGPLLLLLWLVALLVVVGLSFNPTLRYLWPGYGVMAVLAAHYLLSIRGSGAWRYLPLALVLVGTLLWALAFTGIYRATDTRIAASDWIDANIPADAALGIEYWDDPLPAAVPGRSGHQYRQTVLDVTGPDTIAKRERLLAALAEVDYVILSSQRGYGSMTRLPDLYPLMFRYYQALFDGVLGFELVAQFTSYPKLAGVTIRDAGAEEAFSVHDHAPVYIFAKGVGFSVDALQEALGSVALPAQTQHIDAPMKPTGSALAPVTLAELDAASRESPLHLLRWVLLLWLFGVTGNALCQWIWPGSHLPGRAILLAGGAYLCACGMNLGLWGAKQGSLLLLAAMLTSAAVLLYRNGPRPAPGPGLIQAGVFWGCFAFFLVLRAHNPAIEWGERPMDFAILNAMLRTDSLPPQDPWFAGEALHYHAWGQYVLAYMGRLAGTPPATLYNLSAALVPALAAELFFWLVYQLTAGSEQRRWPAILGTALVLFTGNLSLWLFKPGLTGLSFMDFWNASRVVPGTINEFPFWTSVFADLHSHFLGMLFSAMFLAALVLLQQRKAGAATTALLAFALACLTLTNSWAAPVYATLLLVGALMVSEAQRYRQVVAVLLATVLLTLPFFNLPGNTLAMSYVVAPIGLAQGLYIFGPFLAVIAVWSMIGQPLRQLLMLLPCALLVLAGLGGLQGLAAGLLVLLAGKLGQQPRSSATELAGAMALCALLVIVGSEWFTLVDRMNTVFKFHFEAWILLALASAVALAQIISTRRFLAPVAMLVLLLGVPTSLQTLVAWWQNPRIASSNATFDGLAYLIHQKPDEALAIAWLQQRVPGQPPILEAYGPGYGSHARISAATGLPAWLGWAHHVSQHGHDREQIDARIHQVEAAYTTLAGAREIARLGVRYGVRCGLEWATYGPETGKYWSAAGWQKVFSTPRCEIWSVTR
tara:strand:- start:6845 stop:10627 length:3783 start_codon:yes stop_codon:yes gene_type:complete